jgi:hypothetical protein
LAAGVTDEQAHLSASAGNPLLPPNERKYMELSQFIPIIESVGFPALIFVIWYVYHKAQVKTFEALMTNNFTILKDLLETNQYHAALLSRIESKIDNNMWCPILRKRMGVIPDEC